MSRQWVFVVALLLSAVASAEDPPSSEPVPLSFEASFRTGYTFAAGDAVSGASMSELTSGMFPLQLGVGVRFQPNLYLGAYFQFGLVSLKNCDGCSANDLRVGVEAQYHFVLPQAPLEPWVGLGIGYEHVHGSGSFFGTDFTESFSGVEFASFHFGTDFRVSPQFGVGPVFSLSLGEYSSATLSDGTREQQLDQNGHALHIWFNVGLRGVFDVLPH
jgi:hypothetical protein